MERIEEDILKQLKTVRTTAGYVDLIVASEIIHSTSLYDETLQQLISSGAKPDLSQSRRIGVDALHAILTAFDVRLSTASTDARNARNAQEAIKQQVADFDLRNCRHCSEKTGPNWTCTSKRCRKAQYTEVGGFY